MKKIVLTAIVIANGLLMSCSGDHTDFDTQKESQILPKQTFSINAREGLKIDWSSENVLELFQGMRIQQGPQKVEVETDKKSRLIIPVQGKSTRSFEIPVCVQISSKNQHCQNGLGFSCKAISSRVCNKVHKADPTSRDQMGVIKYNAEESILVLDFYGIIDWEHLKNN